MENILEIYFQGECIEQRRGAAPYPQPLPGEQVYLEFQNPSYSEEYGNWWVVRTRKHLLFRDELQMQTLQLHCEPDPLKGIPPQ